MSVIIKVEDILLKTIASLHYKDLSCRKIFKFQAPWSYLFEFQVLKLSLARFEISWWKKSQEINSSLFSKKKRRCCCFFPSPWQQISLSCNLSWVIIVRGCHSGSFFAAIGELHSDEGRGWCWCCCRSRSQRCRHCQRRQRSGLI